MSGATPWLRALTLTQPWCGLVASGIKLIENRDNSIIKVEDFGVPFGLHASREIDESVYERIAELAPELLAREMLQERAYGIADGDVMLTDMRHWFDLSRLTSAVIGIATIHRVIRCGTGADVQLALGADLQLRDDQRRWLFGPIGYCLGSVRALETPVPCRGWQGFWHMTSKAERERGEVSAVERAVLAQVGRSAIPNHSEDQKCVR